MSLGGQAAARPRHHLQPRRLRSASCPFVCSCSTPHPLRFGHPLHRHIVAMARCRLAMASRGRAVGGLGRALGGGQPRSWVHLTRNRQAHSSPCEPAMPDTRQVCALTRQWLRARRAAGRSGASACVLLTRCGTCSRRAGFPQARADIMLYVERHMAIPARSLKSNALSRILVCA